jgi:Mob1/phocein family
VCKLREDLHVDPPASTSNARSRNQFKPSRTNKGTTSYQLRQFAEATLGSGSLRKAVKLPEGEDLNEWLAVNGMHEAEWVREGARVDNMT